MTYERNPEENKMHSSHCPCDELVLGNRYARRHDGTQYYPMDRFGNEYRLENAPLIIINNQYIYPLTAQGKPRYLRENETEIYEKINGKPIIGVGADGNQHYAIDKIGNEYYPDDNTPAKLVDGTTFYASSFNGSHIFPLDKFGNEYYVTLIDLTKPTTIPNRYAKTVSGDEIYPIRLNADYKPEHVILNNEYAKDKNNKPFYPKDRFKNEYYKPVVRQDIHEFEIRGTLDRILLDRYALTNDGKVILPAILDKPYIISKIKPNVTEKNVIGRLIREQDIESDFLTNITDETFQPTIGKPYQYKTLDTKKYQLVTPKQPTPAFSFIGIFNRSVPFYRRWCFWVLLFVILIVKLFLLWWFYLKKYIPLTFITSL